MVKLIIDVPREYEQDFIADKFKDFFSRVIADINCDGMCGFYEKEIAEMFLEAFDNAIGDTNLNANVIPVANIHQEKKDYTDNELIDMLVANYVEKAEDDTYFSRENYKEFLVSVYWFWKANTNNFNKEKIVKAVKLMLEVE